MATVADYILLKVGYEKMPLKPISACGRMCFIFVGLFMAICGIVAVSGVYWSVWFWDCGAVVQTDGYYYLIVDQGLCFDSDNDATDDYGYCTSWNTLADNSSGDASSDADAYNNAKGLGGTATTFAFIFTIVTLLTTFVPEGVRGWLRYAQIALLGLCTLFILIVMSSLSNTYYTNVDNYGAFYDNCDSNATFPNAGGTFVFIGFFTGLVATFCVYAPCGSCLGDEEMEQSLVQNQQNQGQQSAQTGTAYGGQQATTVYVVSSAPPPKNTV